MLPLNFCPLNGLLNLSRVLRARLTSDRTHVADVDVDPVSGRKLVNQYEIIDELGRGVHGKVKLGRNLKTGQYVAIKIVDRYSKRKRLGKNGSHEDKIKKEIAILKKARHPNIVSLIEVIDDPGKKKVYIVLEHVEMGEVKWQAEAPREIALVEWRRLDREAHGIFDNEAEFLEDEHILREAQKRRQKKERRKLRDFHRLRLEGSQVRTWSFEHGGETDEDDLDSETASRVSTRTTDAGHSEQHGQVTANLLDPDVQATDFAANPVPDELSQPLAHSKWHEDSTPLSTQPHGHATNLSDQSQPSLIGALEGTMYGAYEPAIPRGRTPSIAGSAASMLDADKSDIPEQFRYVPRMTLTGTRAAFRDTVLGLEYLHYQGVIHRDIKPANLLQTKDHRIKISDFGVSYVGRSSVETTGEDQSESDAPDIDEAVELAKTVGTPAFYAPELCQTDCSTESYPVTGQIDVWALGVTLYCLIFGRVPFHDHNTFALMRLIAEEDVYIPRTRLKAVDEQSSSRPSSHGRMFQQTTSDRRLPHQLIYEEIDDDLYDLLKRLFVKDPSRRIKLTEVKHHPWVLRDIGDPYRWLDETDPSRLTQGKRIEVSKEDVAEAVVPLTMMERARSTARSTLRKIGGALGIGKSASVKRRDRAVSSATNVDGAPLSNGSSSSTLSQDAGRPAMKVDESIFSALKASREGEHPLSQSVTASPECKEHPQFFESAPLRPSSPGTTKSKHSRPTSASRPPRPGLPERAMSSLSTTGSVRTVKQADFLGNTPDLSSEPMPGLPGTPVALDTPTGSNLGGLFGGTGRKIMKSVSLRSRDRYAHDRTKSIDRLVASSDDAHAEPSIAFSTAVAAGMVETPNVLKGYPSTNSVRSPGSSRTPSVTTPEFLHPQQNLSRHSRPSSISSPSPSRPSTAAEHDHRSPSLQHNGGYFPYTGEPSDQQFDRAREENVRRRILEEDHVRSRPGSSHQRPQSALSQLACPPSPDDDLFYQKQKEQIASPQEEPTDTPSLEASPLTRPLGTPLMPMTSSSSEDQLFSGMSQSTSNPSIPSVVSANSSIVPEDGLHLDMHKEASNLSSDDTLHPASDRQDDSEGYAADNAVESCDDDDDESDEDFIVMTRKRSRKEGLTRSESISNAQLSRHRARRETTASIKTNRNGSSNTMRKVRSHSDPSDVDVLKLSRS